MSHNAVRAACTWEWYPAAAAVMTAYCLTGAVQVTSDTRQRRNMSRLLNCAWGWGVLTGDESNAYIWWDDLLPASYTRGKSHTMDVT